jgi:ABC-type glycerol-3-phosphate transport system substrate-binding protein/DNA-binding transcriptional regulator YhcF (GntR family)
MDGVNAVTRVRLPDPIEEAMEIDPELPIPLYFQLKTLLLEEILSGRYSGPQDRVPTEHELCDRYRISRTPVSRALTELADEGVILRHRRRGSFVNPHWLSRRPDQAEIRVVVPGEGPWARMVREAAGSSNQISVVEVPRHSLHQTLTHAVAEGQAPDLALLDNVWAPEFAAAGFIYALEELNESWVRDEHEVDFLAPLVRVNRYEGKTFGVSPFADAAGLWYRRDELQSLGLEPPVTWSELRTVGRAFAEAGVRTPILMPGGSLAGETTAYFLIAFLASNGAQVLGPEGVTLRSPATAQALRFLRGLVEERLVPLEVVGYEWNQTIRVLAEGRAALSFGGSYEAEALAEALGVHHREVWDHFGFTHVPAGPRGNPASVAGGMMFAVFRQAAQPTLAVRLLERIVDPDALARFARSTGRTPSRRSAIELVAPDLPFLSRTAELLEGAASRPWMPSYPRVSAQLQAMLEAVLTGRLGPSAAAQRTADMIGAITGRPVVLEPGVSPVAAVV